ncbi:hypothetical protein EW146_g8330 [Bondarzewia mesenterica]|uniref:Polynucleotide 5'-hydroxyl-kinase GRC3 n=1 Tax=Bondarzewia mesenterica TaxID=1095465 RepID=A0A4S4LF95_9AGAM|nr:hypothetical protein EW146_g8330 [Bondarzewia mesenterica]
MLSAIAARKARLQDSQAREPLPLTQTIPKIVPESKISSPQSSKSTKPPSKRRQSSQGTPASARKKQRKASAKVRKDGEKTRYFVREKGAVDVFELQEDVIGFGQDGSDASLTSEEGQSALEVSAPIVTSGNNFQRHRKRAWSPSRPLPDSSDEVSSADEAAADVAESSNTPRIQAGVDTTTLSTFQPIQDQNVFTLSPEELRRLTPSSEAAVVLVFRASDTLSLCGTYKLTVLRGSISLLGVTLHPSRTTHHIFAPRSSPIPVIEALTERGESSRTEMVSVPDRVRAASGENDSIIMIQEMRTGIEGLGRVVRTFDGIFKPSNKEEDLPQLPISGVHIINRQFRDMQPFYLPPTWETALSAVFTASSSKPTVSFVQGPKNSGKSTFARTLLGRLTMRYRKVAFLECDLGQSEFTPGAMVALIVVDRPIFGPPFTHPTLPHQAHYIGSTSPRSSPSHYLNAIRSLVQIYRLDIQYAASLVDEQGDADAQDERIADVIPLVVNTMGWTKGLGADLTRQLKEIMEPTDIFEIDAVAVDPGWSSFVAAPPSNPVSTHATLPASGNPRIHVLEPVSSALTTRFTAADHRTLSILSYLHADFSSASSSSGALVQGSASAWNTALPLCAQIPYEIDWNIAVDRVFLIGAGTEDVVPSEVLRVLNGAIVALVRTELDMDPDALPTARNTDTVDLPYTQGSPPPDPSNSTTLGLALIRAVSSSPARLQLLTPLPPQLLGQCRVLVKGEMELPVWGMLDFRLEGSVADVERGSVPYLRWGKGEGVGGERRRIRRNLMRRGQM